MGKLTQEQSRFAAINQHQFREREVRRQANLVRFLPAANFIEETRQTMNGAISTCFAFARSQVTRGTLQPDANRQSAAESQSSFDFGSVRNSDR